MADVLDELLPVVERSVLEPCEGFTLGGGLDELFDPPENDLPDEGADGAGDDFEGEDGAGDEREGDGDGVDRDGEGEEERDPPPEKLFANDVAPG